MKMPSEKTRAYVYRVSTAALALAGLYGLVSGEEIAAWTLVASAVTGLASANTSTKAPEVPDGAGEHRAE